jgi:uncharacterized Zn-finger protein
MTWSEQVMADHSIPHFHNEAGVSAIKIGVKEFQCMGAKPPLDHPHVFLDMGSANEIVCPYCSTLYQYDESLKASQSIPEGCLFDHAA